MNDGGPAFARPLAGIQTGMAEVSYEQSGMSLRDYFAAAALPAIIHAATTEKSGRRVDIVEEAFLYADAMIGARSK